MTVATLFCVFVDRNRVKGQVRHRVGLVSRYLQFILFLRNVSINIRNCNYIGWETYEDGSLSISTTNSSADIASVRE